MSKGFEGSQYLPTAICEDVPIPALELVGSTNCVQGFLAGLETEVVGVIEA